jgi:ribonuclease-3
VEYFEQALIHRSYLQVLGNENILSNERLEFLGDSILGMVTAEYLFSLHTDVLEGELTKMRSWLVNKNTLAFCARKIQLDGFLMMSHSASKSLEQGSESILADALEAIIAAIYLDSGFEASSKFIIRSLLPIILNTSVMTDTNYKSILLENVQSNGKEAPRYEVLNEEGPDHEKEFTIAVYVGEDLLGTGKGKTKKQAEQNAALEALQLMNYTINDE